MATREIHVWNGRRFTAEEKARRLDPQRIQSGFLTLLGIRLIDLEPGWARLELPFREEITHQGGVVQGGILTTLADTSIAHAAGAALDLPGGTATLELKINFMRPAGPGLYTAEAWLIHLGKRTAVGEAEVLNEQGKLVAKCSSSLILTGGRQQ